MSVYYVNDVWSDYAPDDASQIILVDCSESGSVVTIDTSDVLSDPAESLLRDVLLSLLPRGAAWRTPDGQAFVDPQGSTMGRTITALAAGFGDLYRRAFQMTEESRVNKVSASLLEWETEWGLPDPCIGAAYDDRADNTEARLTRLRTKVTSPGTITTPDFVRLAAQLGEVVAIELPEVFRCGESPCGGFDELSDAPLEYQWVVHMRDADIVRFQVGVHECGVDPLLDFSGAEILECVFRRQAPGWTYPIFSYAEAVE